MKVFSNAGYGMLGVILALAANTYADGVADKVMVSDAYVRAIPPVVKTTAAFMQLQNHDAVEHFLVGASAPVAGAAELHMHTMDDGVMRMRRIAHIHLPPGKSVALQPGGLHIMMFDLKSPLSPGGQVPITLTFSDGSSKEVSATVRSVLQTMKH